MIVTPFSTNLSVFLCEHFLLCLCFFGPLTLGSVAAGAFLCADATLWFKEPEGTAVSLHGKWKLLSFLLKVAYIVAGQVLSHVTAPWLRVCSPTPNAKRAVHLQPASQPAVCVGPLFFRGAAWENAHTAFQISCNGWLRRGGCGDCTDNYKMLGMLGTVGCNHARGSRWWAGKKQILRFTVKNVGNFFLCNRFFFFFFPGKYWGAVRIWTLKFLCC